MRRAPRVWVAVGLLAAIVLVVVVAVATSRERPSTEAVASSTTTLPPGTAATPTAACRNLGLLEVGEVTDADSGTAPFAGRFAAAFAAGPSEGSPAVCARSLQRWRDDLVIQPLERATRPDGAMVSALDGTGDVFRSSSVEWASFAFRSGGDADHDFAGPPVERTVLDGVALLRTTRGALVMERPDSWGNVVISGAWDVWLAHGGPTGDMGMPMGKPTGTIGEGAHQDFEHGRLHLPGVFTDLEAEGASADRYRWEPIAADAPVEVPDDALRGEIVQITGTSYFVDDDGVRHWLDSQKAWSCAAETYGAVEHKVPGWQLARFPIGAAFVCPTSPTAPI